MSRGKYLSLEEARRKGKDIKTNIGRFCKEHPSKGNEGTFDEIFNAMAKNLPSTEETSVQEHGED